VATKHNTTQHNTTIKNILINREIIQYVATTTKQLSTRQGDMENIIKKRNHDIYARFSTTATE